MVSSICFETEGLSSGRRLYVQVWYNMFYMQRFRQSCRWRSVFIFLKMNPRVRNM